MKRMVNFLMLTAIVGLVAFGCGTQPNPVDSNNNYEMPSAMKISLPEGAVLESATLNLYVEEFSNRTINVHRITAPWDELTVTWNSFGGAYDPTVEATFNDDAAGWKTVDLTALFQSWIDGSYPNYGFLLTEDEYAHFTSKEASLNMPFVSVCYSLNGETVCFDDGPIGDTYIFENLPDDNFGHSTTLKVGLASYSTPIEKQALIQFEIDEMPYYEDGGCTRTIGFWKTHAGFGPQADVVSQYLPIWLGTADGDKSLQVTTAFMAVNIFKMKTYGDPDNGITKLYAQLLAAKLNMAAGAGDMDIAEALSEADAFLAMHDFTDWYGLSSEDMDYVLMLKDAFDDYNNGIIGPGHCDDSGFYDNDGPCGHKEYHKRDHNRHNGRGWHRR